MSDLHADHAMHEYLDALLVEEAPQDMPQEAPPTEVAVADTRELERLLQQASAVKSEAAPVTEKAPQTIPETAATAIAPAEPMAMEDYRREPFQALFFSVAGLKLAVPLKSLGGIHEWKEPNSIVGKPDWYMGIMTNRDDKLHTVNTARWVMPEKYTPQMADELQYRYLIMLSDSQWGLACEDLIGTEALQPDDVQWRKGDQGKRPWLAGVVRDKMCAILDLDAMVRLLDKGLNGQG